MKKCLYCGKDLEKEPKENYIENKVGYFCSEDHFDKYILSLTPVSYTHLDVYKRQQLSHIQIP